MSSVSQPCRSSLARGRQELETGLRQFGAALARQHGVEPFAQAMQMQHVGGGVGQLRLAQALRAPVARLLLLRQIDVEHLAHQILQAMAVGIGAAKAARRSWCSTPAAASRRRRCRARRDRTARSGRSLSSSDWPAAPSGSARRRDPWESAPHRRCRRRSTAAPRRAGRDADAAPWSRYRSPPNRYSGTRSGRSPRCRRMVMVFGTSSNRCGLN